jgi:hypothetical protein
MGHIHSNQKEISLAGEKIKKELKNKKEEKE